MPKGRLEAFSDAVIAIIMTIMVLELKVPHGTEWADLQPLLPVFLTYVLSFVNLGIYWTNHHHLLQATRVVTGGVLWANVNLLFWLSLMPFATGWLGENHVTTLPTVLYGAVLLLSAISYTVLQLVIIAADPDDSPLAAAVGSDRKGKISIALYVVGIGVAFVNPWISVVAFVAVAVIWFVPDRRIERTRVAERSGS